MTIFSKLMDQEEGEEEEEEEEVRNKILGSLEFLAIKKISLNLITLSVSFQYL